MEQLPRKRRFDLALVRPWIQKSLRAFVTCSLSCVSLLSLASSDIVINEIMYNPLNDATEDELEFVEVHNRGNADADISGWQFTDAIAFTFPQNTFLKAGEFLVVCSDPMEMVSQYGVYNVIGPFDGRLANEGEHLALSDDSAEPVVMDEVTYGTGGDWPSEPDGQGPSLELVNPWVDNNVGGNWRASTPPDNGGTPGEQNSSYEENAPPAIYQVSREPLSPTSSQTVNIKATVAGNTPMKTARLTYVLGANPSGTAITLDMTHLGDGLYSAVIPHQVTGTWVWYMIEAVDEADAIGLWPPGAPMSKAWYRVENIPAKPGEIVINEIMYNNTLQLGTDLEWVEIFNTTARTIDVSLWCLKDNEDSHAFYLPMGTFLTAGGYLVLCYDAERTTAAYGITNVIGNFTFRFSDGGAQVRLFNANGLLMDLVEYGDSSPWPDEADGLGDSIECVNPYQDNSLFSNWAPGADGGTPGFGNSVFSPLYNDPDIVINEIMYHTVDDNDEGQFIELFNRGTLSVNLGDWQFTRGITHTFASGTTIPSGGFFVLCKNVAEARARYGFTAPAVAWQLGRLDHGGETLALENDLGATIDIVKYDDDPPWPVAADGFGCSLECINPSVDNNHPRNWRASSGEAYWQFVRRTGTATSSQLYFYMLDRGECLIDDVEITELDGNDDYVPNGDFEASDGGWSKSGTHSGSYREFGTAHSGNACMHIVATGEGGSFADSVSVFTVPELVSGRSYVLSFWVKHVEGDPRLCFHLSGGGLGGQTALAGSGLLCSPGARNSSFSPDLPPFISTIEHSPLMPKPYEVATIAARIEDDAEVALVTLEYKSSLESTWISVEMNDDGLNGDAAAGDGVYTAMTTTYPSQTVVQYTVTAWDTAGNATRTPAMNDPKPNHAYFVYNQDVVSKLPVYFLSIPGLALYSPPRYGLNYDNYRPCTFVFDGRVYENVGIRLRGHSSQSDSVRKKNLKLQFDRSDLFQASYYDDGVRSINLQGMWADKSYLREKLSYDLFERMGVASCATRHTLLYINGQYWGLFLEMESPGSRYLKRNGRDDNGNLYKAYNTGTDANGFEKKTNETDGSKADLVSFLWGINNTAYPQITDSLNRYTDVDSQIAYNAVNAAINNSDAPHKNYFLYHDPTTDRWEMFPWDLDLTYGRNYEVAGSDTGVWNDVIRWNNHIFFATRAHRKNDGPWNCIIDRYFYPEPQHDPVNSVYTEPFRKQMIETTRYVLDTYFTPRLQYREIDALVGLIRDEVPPDRAKWGSYSSKDLDLQPQVTILKGFIAARRDYLFTNFVTDKNAPKRPGNIVPREGDYRVFPAAILQPTAFRDPNGDAHAASQWQIREDDEFWTELVLDSGEDTEHKTSYEVATGVLEPTKVYCWRVRFKDSTGLWGEWSEETSFAIGLDTDADGLCDSVETNSGVFQSAANTGTDPRNPDTDGDGLSDGDEVNVHKTNPNSPDTDQDGLTDREEIATYGTDPNKQDTDGDLMPDLWEITNSLDPTSAAGGDGGVADLDHDGIMNLFEYLYGTNPNDPDTDADGMNDGWEIRYSLSPRDSSEENGPEGDVDEDGLTNLAEYNSGASPRNPDTDGDGLGDLWEVENNLDPNDGTGNNGPDGDPDGDGLTNIEEMLAGTDPNVDDSAFSILSLQPNNPGIVLSWQSLAGKHYQVQACEQLDGEWSPLGEEMTGNGETMTFTDETADSVRTRFYRVVMR
ncbi:MAG: CotH kinase family protein [bacterium]|nr:CotH kinase family protein [bacterium]